MKVKDLRLCLEPFDRDLEVRAHVFDPETEQDYHSRILFTGLSPDCPGKIKAVWIEVDSDREYDP